MRLWGVRKLLLTGHMDGDLNIKMKRLAGKYTLLHGKEISMRQNRAKKVT